MVTIPKKAFGLVATAAEHRWDTAITHGTDTGDNPYLTVRGLNRSGGEFRTTWHTRGTGTYRLFSSMVRTRGTWQDRTLTRTLEYVTSD